MLSLKPFAKPCTNVFPSSKGCAPTNASFRLFAASLKLPSRIFWKPSKILPNTALAALPSSTKPYPTPLITCLTTSKRLYKITITAITPAIAAMVSPTGPVMNVQAAAILGPMLINERKPVSITPHAPVNFPITKSNGPIPAKIAANITTVFCACGESCLNQLTTLCNASDTEFMMPSKSMLCAITRPSSASEKRTLSVKLSKAFPSPPVAF